MTARAPSTLNRSTQPVPARRVFVNADVLPEAWWLAFSASELPVRGVKTVEFLDHRVVVWRTASGVLRAADAFCPHMGTDLGIGDVLGEDIRCAFHKWCFDGAGRCTGTPKGVTAPERARLQPWAVAEKYGYVWIYPSEDPPCAVLDVPALAGKPILWRHGRPNHERAHPHVSMVNGLDAQHLQSIHGIDMQMRVDIDEDQGGLFSASLSGATPSGTWMERAIRWLIGPRYTYAMTYQRTSVASLTVMRDVYFRRPTWVWPELHMLFAYRLEADGSSTTWPIYVAERRPGWLGALRAWVLCEVTRRAYFVLKDDDSKIYDHVRFRADNLVAMDGAVARYVAWVDRLPISRFSRVQGDRP